MSKWDEEERMYDVLKQLDVKTNAHFKEETFQLMKREVEESRKQSSRKEKIFVKRFAIFSLSAFAVAILFILLLNIDKMKEQLVVDQHGGENNQGVVSDREQEDETNDEDTQATRLKMKEITIYPEGMEEARMHQLLDEPMLPFTTYIPDFFVIEPVTEKENVQEIRVFGKDYPYSVLTVGFFAEEINYDEAKRLLDEKLIHVKKKSEEEAFPFLSSEHQLQFAEQASYFKDNDVAINVGLGQHRGQYFYIFSEYTIESGDGWGWAEKVFFDEWVWR